MNEREKLEQTEPCLESTNEPEETIGGAAPPESDATWEQAGQ